MTVNEIKDKSIFTAVCEPVPEYVTCPRCGLDIALWTSDEETSCLFCGHRIRFVGGSTVH